MIVSNACFFQGESDDCINRLTKKDGVLARYASDFEHLVCCLEIELQLEICFLLC